MGSEAVLVARRALDGVPAREVYELGKFAGTWAGDDGVDWSRCDLATLEVRVAQATIGEDCAYMAPEHEDLAVARGVAAELFAFLERHAWEVDAMNEQDRRYEDPDGALVIVGNRYDARPGNRYDARPVYR